MARRKTTSGGGDTEVLEHGHSTAEPDHTNGTSGAGNGAKKPRRTTRKKSRGGRGKTVNIASIAVAANAIFQMVEPFVTAGVIEAAKSRDPAAFIAAVKTGGKAAVSFGNLLEAAGPAVVLGVAKKVASMVGAPRPHVGKVYAY